MYALVFLAAFGWEAVGEEKLLAKLDADVEMLLEDDPQAQEVRKAARLLAETNNSDHWTNYSAATKILRQTRSKAGIPLLLAYMVRHSELSSSGRAGICRDAGDSHRPGRSQSLSICGR